MSNPDKKKKTAAAAKPVDPSKPAKKPRAKPDPNRVKLPWGVRQLARVAKLIKLATKLQPRLAKVSAAHLGDPMTRVIDELTSITYVLDSDAIKEYKPVARANKLAVGARISIKSDEESRKADVFTRVNAATGRPYLDPAAFDNAEIVGDDRTYWMVQCADGMTRAIAKNLATAFVASAAA